MYPHVDLLDIVTCNAQSHKPQHCDYTDGFSSCRCNQQFSREEKTTTRRNDRTVPTNPRIRKYAKT